MGDVEDAGALDALRRIVEDPDLTIDGTESSDDLPSITGYDVVRLVGKGGMGVVYEAVRKRTGERVAVKTIRPEVQADHKMLAIFEREMRVHMKLQHKRIVQFRDFSLYLDRAYLVMEFVETFDLSRMLRRMKIERRIGLACGLALQLLDALAYAHELGMVHRDIKPANVLVGRVGRKINLKLSDFGLAKSFIDAGLSGLTDDSLGGTPRFMAPEQAAEYRFAKPSVDLYAAAATLYFWITGRIPLDPPSTQDIWCAVLKGDRAPIQDWEPKTPKRLAAIIDRSLSLDPADRFATARELRIALRPFATRS